MILISSCPNDIVNGQARRCGGALNRKADDERALDRLMAGRNRSANDTNTGDRGHLIQLADAGHMERQFTLEQNPKKLLKIDENGKNLNG